MSRRLGAELVGSFISPAISQISSWSVRDESGRNFSGSIRIVEVSELKKKCQLQCYY